MNAIARSARSLAPLAVAVSLAFAAAARAEPIILSSGHTDVFEAEYELHDGVPELHLGVHAGEEPGIHYEPAAVILQVKNAAYRSTASLQGAIQTFLGPNAWILPVDLEEAEALGVLEAGVGKKGFPNSNPVTFTMVSAGAANPGKFVLFSAAESNFTRLRADGGSVEVGSFSITTGHIHYNWGFSAPGTYTFDMQASYTGPLGFVESPVETFTFQVVPEPSTWALAGTALLGALGLRRRFLRAGA
jgi:surface-anchored protein